MGWLVSDVQKSIQTQHKRFNAILEGFQVKCYVCRGSVDPELAVKTVIDAHDQGKEVLCELCAKEAWFSGDPVVVNGRKLSLFNELFARHYFRTSPQLIPREGYESGVE